MKSLKSATSIRLEDFWDVSRTLELTRLVTHHTEFDSSSESDLPGGWNEDADVEKGNTIAEIELLTNEADENSIRMPRDKFVYHPLFRKTIEPIKRLIAVSETPRNAMEDQRFKVVLKNTGISGFNHGVYDVCVTDYYPTNVCSILAKSFGSLVDGVKRRSRQILIRLHVFATIDLNESTIDGNISILIEISKILNLVNSSRSAASNSRLQETAQIWKPGNFPGLGRGGPIRYTLEILVSPAPG